MLGVGTCALGQTYDSGRSSWHPSGYLGLLAPLARLRLLVSLGVSSGSSAQGPLGRLSAPWGDIGMCSLHKGVGMWSATPRVVLVAEGPLEV